MRIEIELTATRPPSGHVRTPDAPPRTFEGWLGLMGAISEAIDDAGDDRSDDAPAGDGPLAR